MRKTTKKSALPVYGFALVWVIFCLLFPLFKTWHFIALACSSILVFFILSAIFPGKSVYIEAPEEPKRTGDDKIDCLLAEGELAVAELRALREALLEDAVRIKLDGLITVIDKIFMNLREAPDSYNRIKKFSDFYLPTTIKLLHTYDRFGKIDAGGENITGTRERIVAALDTILGSYEKFFDSLFLGQALDIETDIRVLENLLRKDGLFESEF